MSEFGKLVCRHAAMHPREQKVFWVLVLSLTYGPGIRRLALETPSHRLPQMVS